MHKFEFTGKGGDIFILYLKNFLLITVTLGIYSFWASVNFTRFFYRHTLFDGIPFDYHATGREKFLGFLKSVLFITGLILFFALLAFFLGSIYPGAEYGAALLAWIFFFSISPLLITGARRYLLSRSSWNGVRFHFNGSPQALFIILFKGFFLTLITLGIYYPFFVMNIHRFLITHSSYGRNAKFDFSGKGKEFLFFLLKGFFLTLVTLGIYMFKFQAELTNFYWNRTFFKGVPFRSSLRGMDLFLFFIKSSFFILITLGIALPWIIASYYRLMTKTLELLSGIEAEESVESERLRIQSGEGSAFADQFDAASDTFAISLSLLNS